MREQVQRSFMLSMEKSIWSLLVLALEAQLQAPDVVLRKSALMQKLVIQNFKGTLSGSHKRSHREITYNYTKSDYFYSSNNNNRLWFE